MASNQKPKKVAGTRNGARRNGKAWKKNPKSQGGSRKGRIFGVLIADLEKEFGAAQGTPEFEARVEARRVRLREQRAHARYRAGALRKERNTKVSVRTIMRMVPLGCQYV